MANWGDDHRNKAFLSDVFDPRHRDGHREAAMAFLAIAIAGSVGLAILAPGWMTSFWAWFVIMFLAIGGARAAMRFVQHANRQDDSYSTSEETRR